MPPLEADRLNAPFRPQAVRRIGWQQAFSSGSRRQPASRLKPTLASAVPNWKAGDLVPLGRRTLRVVGIRDDDADQPPVLIVEEAL